MKFNLISTQMQMRRVRIALVFMCTTVLWVYIGKTVYYCSFHQWSDGWWYWDNISVFLFFCRSLFLSLSLSFCLPLNFFLSLALSFSLWVSFSLSVPLSLTDCFDALCIDSVSILSLGAQLEHANSSDRLQRLPCLNQELSCCEANPPSFWSTSVLF